MPHTAGQQLQINYSRGTASRPYLLAGQLAIPIPQANIIAENWSLTVTGCSHLSENRHRNPTDAHNLSTSDHSQLIRPPRLTVSYPFSSLRPSNYNRFTIATFKPALVVSIVSLSHLPDVAHLTKQFRPHRLPSPSGGCRNPNACSNSLEPV